MGWEIDYRYYIIKTKEKAKDAIRQSRRTSDLIFAFAESSIVHVKDVVAYNNCGYRAIAFALGIGEDGWPWVKQDMLRV